ncbi:MAG: ATP-binding protein [Spirochaetota bacterium]
MHAFLRIKKGKVGWAFDFIYIFLPIFLLIEYFTQGNIYYYDKFLYEPFILSTLPLIIYLLTISIKSLISKKEYAIYIFIGIMFFVIGLFYSIFVFIDIIPKDPILNESFFAMSLVFAVALARRYASTFMNLETTQAELQISYDKLGQTNQELANLNHTLEDKVIKRTSQLEDAHKKIIKLEKETLEKQLAGGFAHEMRNALAGAKLVISKILPPSHTGEENICIQNSSLLMNIYKHVKERFDEEDIVPIVVLMKQIVENEEDIERILKIAGEATDRGLKLTRQIMEYTKIGEENIRGDEVVNITKVIQGIADITKEMFVQEDIVLELKLEEIVVLGFENHLHSIVNNLVLNAIDAVKEITENRLIKVICKKDTDFCHIEVIDNGVGIPEENIEKIYEPFYSTKPTTGIGLGLGYIAKLISSYDGTIDVRSSPKQQTKFIVRIPLLA